MTTTQTLTTTKLARELVPGDRLVLSGKVRRIHKAEAYSDYSHRVEATDGWRTYVHPFAKVTVVA
jgi:hypothetical protein